MSRTLSLTPIALTIAFHIACTSPQSATPSPVSRSTSAGSTTASNLWDVTIQTTAVSGPAFCIWTPSVGATFRGDYTVTSSGSVVVFVPPDPIDWDSFTGTLDGRMFSATNPPWGSGAGMCAHYVEAQTLSGSFSPDNNSFSAVETLSLTPDSGQVRTITFSWSGTRR